MALSKSSPVTALATVSSIAASTSSAASDPVDTYNVVQLSVEVLLTYGAATKCARLDCYGSLDGTNYDTAPFASYDMVLVASATTRQTFGVAHHPRYVIFKIANTDTSIAITNASIAYQKQVVA